MGCGSRAIGEVARRDAGRGDGVRGIRSVDAADDDGLLGAAVFAAGGSNAVGGSGSVTVPALRRASGPSGFRSVTRPLPQQQKSGPIRAAVIVVLNIGRSVLSHPSFTAFPTRGKFPIGRRESIGLDDIKEAVYSSNISEKRNSVGGNMVPQDT